MRARRKEQSPGQRLTRYLMVAVSPTLYDGIAAQARACGYTALSPFLREQVLVPWLADRRAEASAPLEDEVPEPC